MLLQLPIWLTSLTLQPVAALPCLHFLSPSSEEVLELSEEQKQRQCDFLRKYFVGVDEELRERCTRRPPEPKRRKSGVACTIRDGGPPLPPPLPQFVHFVLRAGLPFFCCPPPCGTISRLL